MEESQFKFGEDPHIQAPQKVPEDFSSIFTTDVALLSHKPGKNKQHICDLLIGPVSSVTIHNKDPTFSNIYYKEHTDGIGFDYRPMYGTKVGKKYEYVAKDEDQWCTAFLYPGTVLTNFGFNKPGFDIGLANTYIRAQKRVTPEFEKGFFTMEVFGKITPTKAYITPQMNSAQKLKTKSSIINLFEQAHCQVGYSFLLKNLVDNQERNMGFILKISSEKDARFFPVQVKIFEASTKVNKFDAENGRGVAFEFDTVSPYFRTQIMLMPGFTPMEIMQLKNEQPPENIDDFQLLANPKGGFFPLSDPNKHEEDRPRKRVKFESEKEEEQESDEGDEGEGDEGKGKRVESDNKDRSKNPNWVMKPRIINFLPKSTIGLTESLIDLGIGAGAPQLLNTVLSHFRGSEGSGINAFLINGSFEEFDSGSFNAYCKALVIDFRSKVFTDWGVILSPEKVIEFFSDSLYESIINPKFEEQPKYAQFLNPNSSCTSSLSNGFFLNQMGPAVIPFVQNQKDLKFGILFPLLEKFKNINDFLKAKNVTPESIKIDIYDMKEFMKVGTPLIFCTHD